MPGLRLRRRLGAFGHPVHAHHPGLAPPTSRPGIIDRVSSMQIFGGIAAALYHRERTGKGQKVEFNLYHTGVWMVGADIMDALVGCRCASPTRTSRTTPSTTSTRPRTTAGCSSPPATATPAADPTAPASGPFCRALDRPDLADDPRFETTALRQENRKALKPMLERSS